MKKTHQVALLVFVFLLSGCIGKTSQNSGQTDAALKTIQTQVNEVYDEGFGVKPPNQITLVQGQGITINQVIGRIPLTNAQVRFVCANDASCSGNYQDVKPLYVTSQILIANQDAQAFVTACGDKEKTSQPQFCIAIASTADDAKNTCYQACLSGQTNTENTRETNPYGPQTTLLPEPKTATVAPTNTGQEPTATKSATTKTQKTPLRSTPVPAPFYSANLRAGDEIILNNGLLVRIRDVSTQYEAVSMEIKTSDGLLLDVVTLQKDQKIIVFDNWMRVTNIYDDGKQISATISFSTTDPNPTPAPSATIVPPATKSATIPLDWVFKNSKNTPPTPTPTFSPTPTPVSTTIPIPEWLDISRPPKLPGETQ